jgi:hypothetical protein
MGEEDQISDPRREIKQKRSQRMSDRDPRSKFRSREISIPELDKIHKGQVVDKEDERRDSPNTSRSPTNPKKMKTKGTTITGKEVARTRNRLKS